MKNVFKEKLVELNNSMLGLGAPDERDYQGYNKPDFFRMDGLSYYPYEMIEDLHCYMILQTLMKYKNTQLASISEELDKINEYFNQEYPDYKVLMLKDYSIPDYLDGLVRKKGILLNKFTIDPKLADYINEHEECFRYVFVKKEKRLELLWNGLDKTIAYLKKQGFITDRLEEIAKEGQPSDDTDYENVGSLTNDTIKIINVEDGYMYLNTKYNKEVVNFVRTSSVCSNHKIGDIWCVKAPVHGSESLLDAYRSQGYDTKEIEKIISETPYEDISKPKVHVEEIQDGFLYLSYQYSPYMYKITSENKSRYRLIKKDEKYLLIVNPFDADELLDEFDTAGYDVQDVTERISETIERISSKPVSLEIKSNAHGDYILIFESACRLMLEITPESGLKRTIHLNCFDILDDDAAFVLIEKAVKSGEYKPLKDLSEIINRRKKRNVSYQLKYPVIRAFEPYDFQIEDMTRMLALKKCLLANDMGCGKTMESVWVGLSLPFSKLIICPSSLRLNWKREIRNFAPDADIEIIYNDSEEIREHEWMIIGYSSVKKHLDKLLELNIRCVMADEAHFIKAININGDPTSQRADAVLRLARDAEYCYAITGTPKTSANKDLFNLLKFIKHPLTKEKFISYAERYCDGYQDTFGYSFSGNSNDKELNELIKPYMIRHLKSEVLPDLKKLRQVISIDTNIKDYTRFMNKAIQEKANKAPRAVILALITKAKQALALSKIKETINMADTILDGDKSLVIATCFSGVVDALEKRFKDNCVKIVGGMTDEQKDKAIDDFQSGKKKLIILNMQAGGVGITLTKSYIMLVNDFPWTTGELTQMEDRICRTGQTETCIIYYMVSNGVSIEQKLTDTLTKKSETINNTIDGGLGEEINIIKLIDESTEMVS